MSFQEEINNLHDSFESKISDYENHDLSYWYNIVKERVGSTASKLDIGKSLDLITAELIYGHADEYWHRLEVSEGDPYSQGKSYNNQEKIGFIKMRIEAFGLIFSALSNLEENINITQNKYDNQISQEVKDKLDMELVQAKSSLYGAIKYALIIGIEKKDISYWYAGFIDDPELIKGIDPMRSVIKDSGIEMDETVPLYDLTSEERDEVPDWFGGSFYKEGKLIKSTITENEVFLNALERSVWDFSVQSHIRMKQNDEVMKNFPVFDTKENFEKAKKWFEQNNIDAYKLLFVESDKEELLNDKDYGNDYINFSREDAINEREKIKELYKKGSLVEEEYLARVTPLQKIILSKKDDISEPISSKIVEEKVIKEQKSEEEPLDFENNLDEKILSKIQSDDFESAIIDLIDLLEREPENSIALVGLIECNFHLEDFNEALNYAKRLIKISPSRPEGFYWSAVCKGQLFDHFGALNDFDQVLKLDSNYPDIYHNRAVCKQELNDYQGAIDDLKKSLEINPQDDQAPGVIGHLYTLLEDWRSAIIYLDMAIDINSDDIDSYKDRMGAKFNLGDMEGLISDCKKLLDLDPENPEIHAQLGNIHGSQDNWEESLKCLNKAIEIEPDAEAHVFYDRGITLLNLDRRDEALVDLIKSSEMGHKKAEEFLESTKVNSEKLTDWEKEYFKEGQVDTAYVYQQMIDGQKKMIAKDYKGALDHYLTIPPLIPLTPEGKSLVVYAVPEDIGNGVVLNVIHMSIAHIYFALKDYKNSVKYYFEAISVVAKEDRKKDILSAYAFFVSNQASKDFSNEQYEPALALFELLSKILPLDDEGKSETLKPTDPKHLNVKFSFEFNEDEEDKGFGSLELMAQHSPIELSQTDNYINIANCHEGLKNHKEVIDNLNKAISISNEPIQKPSVFLNLGNAKLYLEDSTSIEEYNKAIELDIDFANAYYMRAVAIVKFEQDQEKALIDVKKYLEYEPDDQAGNKLFKILSGSEDLLTGWKKEAIGGKEVLKYYYQGDIEIFSSDDTEDLIKDEKIKLKVLIKGILLISKGNNTTKIKDFSEIERCLGMLVNSGENMAIEFNDLAYMYYKVKDYLSGIASAQRSLIMEPDKSYAYDTIGEGYSFLEEYDQALNYFDKAIEQDIKLEKFREDHLINRISCLIKLNLKSRALNDLNRLKEVNPGNVKLNELLKLIKRIGSDTKKSQTFDGDIVGADYAKEYLKFSKKKAIEERNRIKILFKSGDMEEEIYLKRVTILQKVILK